jgi:hypothetical protein
MIQILQIAGALLILAAYAAVQRGWLGPDRFSYQALNLVGAALLAVIAALEEQWGFLLLETVWVLITLPPLVRLARTAA